ncbi:MAG: general secretion pathway protein E [Cellvibrionaceae bacterium]
MVDRRLDISNVLEELVKDQRLTQKDANTVTSNARTREQLSIHPLNYLASLALDDRGKTGQKLTDPLLCQWLADKVKLPLFHIDPLKIDVSGVTEAISFAYAKRHGILCVSNAHDSMTVAVSQPYMSGWEDQVEHITKKPLKKVFANPADIKRYTVEFYSLSKSVFGASNIAGKQSMTTNFEQLLELGELKDPEANDEHVINIVDWLLQYAFDQRASDIHIEPRREVCKLRFRIDGVLHHVYELPAAVGMAVTSRLKILGRMNVAEKRKPQDGRIKTRRFDNSEVELRLSTLPTAFGEKFVLRIFDPEVLLRSFSELGLHGEDLDRWHTMTTRPNGIILVTGPTGSGKTTTLYSTMKLLATSEVNVSSIEDPIEMVEDSFNQTQVNNAIDLDFSAGVRTLLRQDPDIIMVGEIRDRETAQMAVQAALTGHLVLSTLHTNDAPSAITRLLDLGLPGFLIKSTLLGVMAQRLVRTLCPHCKEGGDISQTEWNNLVKPWKAPLPKKVYRPNGCLECRNTGYLGRQGIYEIMSLSDQVRDLITDDCDLDALRKLSMKEGMKSLRLSGAQKIANGVTTLEEVLRVAPPTDMR